MGHVVLITGSREASPEMLAKAVEVVRWCQREGYTILVGDAPGIDLQVRRACQQLGYASIIVFGAYGKIRFNAVKVGRFVPLQGDYLSRDRVMAQQCSLCVCLWNGRSHGAKYTAEHVQSLGKRVIWRVFPAPSSPAQRDTI